MKTTNRLGALRATEPLGYTSDMIKFPYGISDFQRISTESYLYVDRTDLISMLEAVGAQLHFLRPRRFGKRMLLSMVENYQDLARADEFPQLFGHLKWSMC